MILILIFAEALALYGLIVGIILSSRAGQSRAEWNPEYLSLLSATVLVMFWYILLCFLLWYVFEFLMKTSNMGEIYLTFVSKPISFLFHLHTIYGYINK